MKQCYRFSSVKHTAEPTQDNYDIKEQGKGSCNLGASIWAVGRLGSKEWPLLYKTPQFPPCISSTPPASSASSSALRSDNSAR